jgi:hypothetical protein
LVPIGSGVGGAEFTIVGAPVRIKRPGTVVAVGMVPLYGGARVFVGLYRDSGGSPGGLLTHTTSAFSIEGDPNAANAQVIEIAVPQFQIPAIVDTDRGDQYWVVEESDSPIELQGDNPMIQLYEVPQPTFAPVPMSAPVSADSTMTLTPALYIVMAQ